MKNQEGFWHELHSSASQALQGARVRDVARTSKEVYCIQRNHQQSKLTLNSAS